MLHSLSTREEFLQAKDERGDTPLLSAILKNDLKSVKNLIHEHYALKIDLCQKNTVTHCNPLHYATRYCAGINMLTELLNTPLKNHINDQNDYGLTPAHIAATNQDTVKLRILHCNGSDFDLQNIRSKKVLDLLNADLRKNFKSDMKAAAIYMDKKSNNHLPSNTRPQIRYYQKFDQFASCNILLHLPEIEFARI